MAFATSQNTDQLLTRGLAFRLPNNAPISSLFTLYANGAGQTYWSNSINPRDISTLSSAIGELGSTVAFQQTEIDDLYGAVADLSTALSTQSNAIVDSFNSTLTGFSTFSTFYADLASLSNVVQTGLSTLSTTISVTNSNTIVFVTSTLTSTFNRALLSTSSGLFNYTNRVSSAVVFTTTFNSTTAGLNRAILSSATGLNNTIVSTNNALTRSISTVQGQVTSTNSNFYSTINGYGPRIVNLETTSTGLSTTTGVWISSQLGVSQSTQDGLLNVRIAAVSTYLSSIAVLATAQFGQLSTFSTTLYNSIIANNSTNDTQNAQISTLAQNLSVLTTSSILAGVYDTFIQLENYTVGLVNAAVSTNIYWQSSLYYSTILQTQAIGDAYYSTFFNTVYQSTVSAATSLTEAYVSTYTSSYAGALNSTNTSVLNSNCSTAISVLFSTSYTNITNTNSTLINVLYSTGYGFLASSFAVNDSRLNSTVVFIGSNAGSTLQGQYGVAVGFSAGQSNQSDHTVAIGAFAGSELQGFYATAVGAYAGWCNQGPDAIAIGDSAGSINQSTLCISIGVSAGLTDQGDEAIAIGNITGATSQGQAAISIGSIAGLNLQGRLAIAIGSNAGSVNQGALAIAIGNKAGVNNQHTSTIILNATGETVDSISTNSFYVAPIRNDESIVAGFLHYNTATNEIVYNAAGGSGGGNQSTFLVPIYVSTINTLGDLYINTSNGVEYRIGVNTSTPTQTVDISGALAFSTINVPNLTIELTNPNGTIAIGAAAGVVTQGASAISIGNGAGNFNQVLGAIAIGKDAAGQNQGPDSIAIGTSAGYNAQIQDAVAIGNLAGNLSQGLEAVAMGLSAGQTTQGQRTVAIGSSAGKTSQGDYAVAIGYAAGSNSQTANSIVLNASGSALNTTAAGFYVNPVRSNAAIPAGIVHYDTTTRELVYNNVIYYSTARGQALSASSFGVNTAVPAYFVDVVGGTIRSCNAGTTSSLLVLGGGYDGAYPLTGGAPAVRFDYRTLNGGYPHYILSRHDILVNSSCNALDFWLHNSASAFGTPGINNKLAMSVTAAGVGISTSNPTFSLHTAGSGYFSTLSAGPSPAGAAFAVDVFAGTVRSYNTANTTSSLLVLGGGYDGAPLTSAGAPAIRFDYRTANGVLPHYILSRHDTAVGSSCNSLDFWINNSASFFGTPGTNNTLALSLTAAGIGMGTSSPRAKLELNTQGTSVSTLLRVVAGTVGSNSTSNKSGLEFQTVGAGGGGVTNAIVSEFLLTNYGISFLNGFVNAGTSVMRVDMTNSRVGFNTTQPAYLVDATAGTIRSCNVNTTSSLLVLGGGYLASYPLTGGAPAIRFDFQATNGSFPHYILSRHNSVASSTGNALDFWIHNSASAFGTPGTNNTLAMSVTAAGVGIGLSSPQKEFNVAGDIHIQSNAQNGVLPAGGPQITIGQDSAGTSGTRGLLLKNRNDNSVAIVRALSTNSALYLAAGGQNAHIAITSNGNIGIGTESPTGRLDIRGTTFTSTLWASSGGQMGVASQTPLLFAGKNESGAPNVYYTWILQSSTFQGPVASTLSLYTYDGSYASPRSVLAISPYGRVGINVVNPVTYQFELSQDSAGKPTTNTWTISSDERIKKNIVSANLDLCLSNIKSLPLRYFEWDDRVYDSTVTKDRRNLGFIAQEVKPLFPKCVDVIPEANGFSNFHTLNVDQIYKTHIGATQKLIEIIQAQQSTLNSLVARLG